MEDFVNPPFGNLADVYRLRLGRAYSARDEKLRINDVLACCGNDSPALSHKGPCAMGVDVGKIKHIVIGQDQCIFLISANPHQTFNGHW